MDPRHIASEKVLVACQYGVGRCAWVVIGYLCNLGFKYKQTLDIVSSKRLGEIHSQILRKPSVSASVTWRGVHKCTSQ
ncbi:MAG: dual specificity protein phosphatase family protein [Deltaproteobacteria bacterium]|nr:dual specificity protein phosphatase family protein [Deltaproteobacteria bacterium]